MRRDVWFFLFFIGVLLFGWPLMSIFLSGLATYLFVIWLLFIVLIYLATKVTEREDGGR
jgi:hypothetical protein